MLKYYGRTGGFIACVNCDSICGVDSEMLDCHSPHAVARESITSSVLMENGACAEALICYHIDYIVCL
jgi:hypothetical protein